MAIVSVMMQCSIPTLRVMFSTVICNFIDVNVKHDDGDKHYYFEI